MPKGGYPSHLLPSIEKNSKFVKDDNCLLVRRSSSTFEKMFDEDGLLEDVAIEENRLLDYSLNIVFCDRCVSVSNLKSEINDIFYKSIDKTHSEEWDYKDSSVPLAKDIEYELNNKDGYFVLTVSQVNDIKGNYPYSNKGDTPPVHQFIVQPDHRPTKINFLHFQFHCVGNHEGNGLTTILDNDSSRGIKNRVRHLIKEEIKKIVTEKNQAKYLPQNR